MRNSRKYILLIYYSINLGRVNRYGIDLSVLQWDIDILLQPGLELAKSDNNDDNIVSPNKKYVNGH